MHLEKLARDTGETPEQLIPVDCPDELKVIWEHFQAMNLRRGGSGFGMNPISNTEIAAWASLNGVEITPFEAEALDRIEAQYLLIHAKAGEGEAAGPKAAAPSEAPTSGEVVYG